MTNLGDLADSLHRTVKLALDSGEASSIGEAQRIFQGYRIQIAVGAAAHRDPALQAAALTAVNCATRTFLGGVSVVGANGQLVARIPGHDDWHSSVVGWGAVIRERLDPDQPTLVIGDDWDTDLETNAIRVAVHGWCGGVLPVAERLPGTDTPSNFTPAGVLAGALGVSEIFQRVRRSNPNACRRGIGLNLWRVEQDWRSTENGPPLRRIPESLWIVGLGNLGQAYLWTLGLLPYSNESATLILQDFDQISESNLSTSVLSTRDLVGLAKTRAMAAWAEARGFRTQIIERRFSDNFCVDPQEPVVALIGVDNTLARTFAASTGFSRVIEAGLGAGEQDFLGVSMHTLPAQKSAREIWPIPVAASKDLDKPAYRDLVQRTGDTCGTTNLAGRTVGAPFVGAFAAALVIAELLRLVECDQRYEVVTCHLRNLSSRGVHEGEPWPPINIGSIAVKP